ncbi:MAG: YdcF family protein [Gemmatimonadaceae bacterium]
MSSTTTARIHRALYAALLGALAGFFAGELGFSAVAPGQLSDLLLVVVGAVAGLLLGVAGWMVVVGVADGVLFGAYLVIACTPLMSRLAPAWVRQDAWSARPDAVVVLSSSVQPDSALDQVGFSRLVTGIEIVKRDSIAWLVTTRVRLPHDGTVSSEIDQRRMIALTSVPARWDVIDSVYSTRDEAVRSARLLLPAGAKTVVVVTSPMHTRRACATFEGAGFTVYCQPAREHEHMTWHPRNASDRLAAFREYFYERLGMVKYRAKGWLTRGAGTVRS